MASTAAHGGPKRVPFLPASRSYTARSCHIVAPQKLRVAKLAASGGFRPDHGGASQTDATAVPTSLATTASHAPSPAALLPYFASLIGHLRGHANSLVQHLSTAEQASFLSSLGLGLGPHAGFADATDKAHDDGGGAAWRLLPLQHHVQLLQPRGFGTAHPLPPPQLNEQPHQQDEQPHQQQQELQDPQQQPQQHADDGHFWAGPVSTLLPWSHGGSIPGSSGGNATATGSRRATFAAAAAATSPLAQPPPSDPLHEDDADGPSDAQRRRRLGAHTAGLALLWHSALSLQQRALMTALWRMGQAVGAAEKARRSLPPAAEVPALVHWGAVVAAAHTEEALALALARTATAATAAAAGVPAAAAAVTGNSSAAAAAAAAAAVVTAPHLPLLRHARRRLLAAVTPLLERLRGLQRGCTTHVFLRFLLFSALNPRMRRDLRVRLDVLARRAVQVALLQEQQDAWLTLQMPAPPSPSTGTTARGPSSSLSLPADDSAAACGGSPFPASLSARWYRGVFAPEMLACVRQLELEAPGSPPDDKAAGDPPGRFDLRDLYRLIRVLEVAVEDLERYQ